MYRQSEGSHTLYAKRLAIRTCTPLVNSRLLADTKPRARGGAQDAGEVTVILAIWSPRRGTVTAEVDFNFALAFTILVLERPLSGSGLACERLGRHTTTF